MRGPVIAVLGSLLVGGVALAQTSSPTPDPADNPGANSAASDPTKRAPAQPQPQGPTGPIETTTGGTPPSSPQGDTPPGMQPRPGDPARGVEPKK